MWHLRTTSSEDFSTALTEAVAGERRFLWFHVKTPCEKIKMAGVIRRAGLVLLPAVPCWFVVACRHDVSNADRLRMIRSILDGAQIDVAVWRGKMFGYTETEINWYVSEMHRAWEAYNHAMEGESL